MESSVNKESFEHEPMTAFTFGSFQAKDMVDVLMSSSDEELHCQDIDPDTKFKIQRVDRALTRTLGNFKKINEDDPRELAFDEEPVVLVIPNRKSRLVRCLALIETFDKTIGSVHHAWINGQITLSTESNTIRTLQGRLYHLFRSVLNTPLHKREK